LNTRPKSAGKLKKKASNWLDCSYSQEPISGTAHMLQHRDADLNTRGLAELHLALGRGAIYQVDRQPRREAIEGKCYWNVGALVERVGGSPVYGWAIFDVPHVVIFGWHHAVWQSPSNVLVDISPSPLTGHGRGSTLFVLDSCQEYDISWPLGFSQVFQPVSQDPIILRFVAAANKLAALQLAYMEEQRAVTGAQFEVKSGKINASARGIEQLGAIEKAHRPAIDAAMAEQSSSVNELLRVQRYAAQR
jgi:hypothetical protein